MSSKLQLELLIERSACLMDIQESCLRRFGFHQHISRRFVPHCNLIFGDKFRDHGSLQKEYTILFSGFVRCCPPMCIDIDHRQSYMLSPETVLENE